MKTFFNNQPELNKYFSLVQRNHETLIFVMGTGNWYSIIIWDLVIFGKPRNVGCKRPDLLQHTFFSLKFKQFEENN